MIKLPTKTIDKLFEDHEKSVDVLIALYKIAIPDFDDRDKISGFPKANRVTNTYIGQKMIDKDKANKVNHQLGGYWLNKGFSTEEGMKDWEVVYDG